ncbi:MAG: alpha/beta fold hydrolase [Planctomycetota bacterium]
MPETSITLQSSTPGTTLAGTLSLPDDAHHAVLLLPGSGPQDRDETLEGQAPFRVLAQLLAELGIATLRCDDRGEGESEGDYLAIDGPTLLADAQCQLDALREQVPGVPVSVLGHSQGALFALRLAAKASVDRVIFLAGAVRPGFEMMMAMREQLADDVGYDDELRAAFLEHSRLLFEAVVRTEDPIDREHAVRELLAETVEGATDEDFQPDFENAEEYLDFAVADTMEWEVRELLLSDGCEDLARCVVPVLGLWGSVDVHLDAEAEREAFDAAAPGGSRSELLPGLNHLFQQSETGSIDDYESDGPPMREPVAELIASWCAGRRA